MGNVEIPISRQDLLNNQFKVVVDHCYFLVEHPVELGEFGIVTEVVPANSVSEGTDSRKKQANLIDNPEDLCQIEFSISLLRLRMFGPQINI